MDSVWLICGIICSILSLMTAMLNIFFIYCLWCLQGDSLQGPLRRLLTWCVVFGLIYNAATLFAVYAFTYSASPVFIMTAGIVYFFFACIALVSPSWFSVFYYFSIVPQTSSIMAWTKKNVSLVVFLCGLIDFLFIALSAVFMTVAQINHFNEDDSGSSNLTNITSFVNEETQASSFSLGTVLYFCHLQLSFWTLALTWGATFIYLDSHMKAMVKNNGSFSQTTYQSQMRVTIIGLVQAAFFLTCCFYVTMDAIIRKGLVLHYGLVTFCSVLGLVNCLCLGLSQSVFRQQVVLLSKTIWNKLGCA